MKKFNVKSEKQTGGITAGVINVSNSKKKSKSKLMIWAGISTIIATLIVVLNFLGVDNMFKKQKDPKQNAQEVYDVKSENQTGGVTAGKIEKLIITDKESLGIREPLGLYKDGKKVGTVVNPIINEKNMIFTFDEIQLDRPMPNSNADYIFSPFEFDKYIIQVTHAETIVIMLPPGATKVRGKILEIK